jgi:hypothetical protein
MNELMKILTNEIGLSREAASALINEYGELAAQTHAMYCLWMMDKGKVHTPPAWYTASLRHNWRAPYGMPSDWLPTVMNFRVDENTFAAITRDILEEIKAT